jgi:hypothetical protein
VPTWVPIGSADGPGDAEECVVGVGDAVTGVAAAQSPTTQQIAPSTPTGVRFTVRVADAACTLLPTPAEPRHTNAPPVRFGPAPVPPTVNVPDDDADATAVQPPAAQFDAAAWSCCCVNVSPDPVVVGVVNVLPAAAPSFAASTTITSPVCHDSDAVVTVAVVPATCANPISVGGVAIYS